MGLYLGKEKINNLSVGYTTLGITDISDETTINISGILKGENNKIVSATPGVDYVIPGDSTVTSVNGQTGAVILSASDINAQSTITVNGILKGDGAGGVSAAIPGTDYLAEAPVTSVNGKTGEVKLVKADVGLSQVHNVTQYSAKNPPPYPVTSVNGHTGAITIREVPAVTTSDNGKFMRVVNGAWTATTAPNRFTFTATANQSTFTIPFDFEDSSALTVYYNGIMMKETDKYTVSGKDITLVGFTAEAGDYLTVMGIEGAAAIDYGKEAAEAIKQIQAVKTSAINEINTVKTDTIERINAVVAELPQDLSSIMSTNKANAMAANSKITMDSTYTPSANGDVATKKYVDDSKHSIVGTSTTYPIYIGSSTPASGTAPLLWIDTTASTGTFKYRTSTTGTWKTVPVAWS